MSRISVVVWKIICYIEEQERQESWDTYYASWDNAKKLALGQAKYRAVFPAVARLRIHSVAKLFSHVRNPNCLSGLQLFQRHHGQSLGWFEVVPHVFQQSAGHAADWKHPGAQFIFSNRRLSHSGFVGPGNA